ncbi:hypothetical protein REPUB_Repub18cG0067700 [Reevesia pubescens]
MLTNTLSSQLFVLRLCFLNNDTRCIIFLKSKPTLVDGVNRVEEHEEELDSCVARACVEDPARLGKIESRILKRVKEEFGIGDEMGFVCVECDSAYPDGVKTLLEEFLKDNGIDYSYMTKFAIFRSGELP